MAKCLKAFFTSEWVIRARMVMEKLKSWNALSNFPTTTAAAVGIFVLKNELVQVQVQGIPRGLKPAYSSGLLGTTEAVPLQKTAGK